MYIPWVAVGWKLGAGKLDKCPGLQAIARLVLSCGAWGGEWLFEIVGLVCLGIVLELACLLGGGSGRRIVRKK